MAIQTNLPNRIRNTQLPLSQGLMPLFEAVQNSIHAIEERESAESGRILVEIVREPVMGLDLGGSYKKRGPETQPEIYGFKVTDNGVGFTDRNLESFETLDSDLKAKIGGKGIGRLLWLKTFRSIKVTSAYATSAGDLQKREFDFSAVAGIANKKDRPAQLHETQTTTVELSGFDERYRSASRKTLDAIANQLLEHCLWYYVRSGGARTQGLNTGVAGLGPPREMIEDFVDHRRIFDARHDLDRAATVLARLCKSS